MPGYFKQCGHTCTHTGKNAHVLPVFFNVGNAIKKHKESKSVHGNCSIACCANPQFTGPRVTEITLSDQQVKDMADQLWVRFPNNRSALELIPRNHLTNAKYRNQHRRLFNPSSEAEDEGEGVAPAPVSGPSGTTHSSPTPASGPTPIHQLKGTIFQNITDILKSDFYTEHITLCLVEDPTRATTLEDASKIAHWMVEIHGISSRTHSKFTSQFPNLAFSKSRTVKVNYYWEWVCLE